MGGTDERDYERLLNETEISLTKIRDKTNDLFQNET